MFKKQKTTTIPAPPKGTRILPDRVHRNFTPIVDVWRTYALPPAKDVTDLAAARDRV